MMTFDLCAQGTQPGPAGSLLWLHAVLVPCLLLGHLRPTSRLQGSFYKILDFLGPVIDINRGVVSKTRHPGCKIKVSENRDLVENSKNDIK